MANNQTGGWRYSAGIGSGLSRCRSQRKWSGQVLYCLNLEGETAGWSETSREEQREGNRLERRMLQSAESRINSIVEKAASIILSRGNMNLSPFQKMPVRFRSGPIINGSFLTLFTLIAMATACILVMESSAEDVPESIKSREEQVAAVLSEDSRPSLTLPEMKGGTVYLIPSSGQSNSIGAGGGLPRSIKSTSGNLFAVQAGRKITRLSEPTVSAIEPLRKESHVTSMGVTFAAGAASRPRRSVYVFSSHGIGGMQISALRQGGETGSYEDMLKTVSLVRDAARNSGSALIVPYVAFIHGEADAALGLAASYFENLAAYAADLNRDIPAITGQKEPVRLVISQVSGGYGYYALTGSWFQLWQIKQSQWLMSRFNRNVVLAGPTYQFPLEKGRTSLHFTAEGYEMLGGMMGKAMSYMSRTGRKWLPLSPKSVRQEDGKVVIAFHVPVRPLRWDARLTAPERGFELFDRRGRVKLQSISLREDEVVLEPARLLRGRVRVRYGFRPYPGNPAGGGSLTDSDQTVSPHGFRMSNYCVLFQMRER